MAKTLSTMLPLGTKAPNFNLQNTEGTQTQLEQFSDAKALVVMFICNHCPYVIHVRSAITQLASDYQKKGVAFFAINSNDIEKYPDDNFESMIKEKKLAAYPFPYLLDDSQEIAKQYMAACTPDFFVFDHQHKLAYRGQMDGSRPGNEVANDGIEIRSALDAITVGKPCSSEQTPSMGCNIKWKDGNEPSYFPN